jgi:hypothetical protein
VPSADSWKHRRRRRRRRRRRMRGRRRRRRRRRTRKEKMYEPLNMSCIKIHNTVSHWAVRSYARVH